MLTRTLASPSIVCQCIAIRTLASVASWSIIAKSNAEIVFLKSNALVDVLAGPVIRTQFVAWPTSTSVTTPGIVAFVLTETRLLAFVHIRATGQGTRALVTRLANAAEGARRVDAMSVLSTDKEGMSRALIHIHTVLAGIYGVTCYVERKQIYK